ncbi:MAG TPA: peptidylprolyl isomerase [Pyrinomonadaceae bacterium]|nr:peptidylprolyl isomerase [Pyrinomonadaceae bacterium]
MKTSGTKLLIALMFFALSLSACNEKNSSPATNANAGETKTGNVKSGVKPEPDSQVAVIETADYGRIVIELYPNVAPQMVERFKKLISEHFYDGTAIHRVDKDLGIIQGGDPNTKGSNVDAYGMGNSPYPNVPAEFSDIPYDRGTVGAARTQDVNGANCQWFITLKKQPAFDKKYTVFGRVIDGIKNAEVIMGAPTAAGTPRPSDKVVIKSVTLQPRSNFPAQ